MPIHKREIAEEVIEKMQHQGIIELMREGLKPKIRMMR